MSAADRLAHALTAMADRRELTPCQGRQGHKNRWTSDDYEELEWAAWHCVSLACPLLELCGAAADEHKEKAHVWGGTVRAKPPKRKDH